MYLEVFRLFKSLLLFVIVMSIVFYLNTGGLITTNMQFFVYMAEENNGIMRDFGQNNKNIEFLNIKEELLIYVKCSLKV